MPNPPWDIRRYGCAWASGDALPRLELAPEKFGMTKGRRFSNEEQHLTLRALPLENSGIDAAVQLGDPRLWRAAIDALAQPDR